MEENEATIDYALRYAHALYIRSYILVLVIVLVVVFMLWGCRI